MALAKFSVLKVRAVLAWCDTSSVWVGVDVAGQGQTRRIELKQYDIRMHSLAKLIMFTIRN